MNLPIELVEAELTHYQFRLLLVLCHLSDRYGVIETSVANLVRLTQVKAESHVKASLKVLEAKGLLGTTRTKRNRGFYSFNRYTLSEPLQRLWTPQPEPLQRLTTHGSPDLLVNSHIPIVPIANITNKSISNENIKNIKITKVSKDLMNKSWRDEQDSDSNVGGFGKLESEQPRSTPNKSETKTRGKRPKDQWTARDVAAEFSFLVGRKFPWLPGTVNVNHLSGALAKMRKQYQTTALLELEILKYFMADENNFKDVGDEAPHLYKRYLAMFRTHMNKARETLGLVNPTDETEDEFVYASDGRKFANTIVGRKSLQRHEDRLNAKI